MRKRSASRFCPRTRLFTDPISGLQLFLYVQASEFACLPGRSYRCKFPCRAAEAFTSELSVHRCLCTHRTYYPPDNRQLAERGLTPRKIHSIVDCSSHFWGALQCPPVLPHTDKLIANSINIGSRSLNTYTHNNFHFKISSRTYSMPRT